MGVLILHEATGSRYIIRDDKIYVKPKWYFRVHTFKTIPVDVLYWISIKVEAPLYPYTMYFVMTGMDSL